jgi:hypothetical protein
MIVLGVISSCQTSISIDDENKPETAFTTDIVENLPSEISAPFGREIRQWAVEAEASSEYANPEWSANQVLGPPDTEKCGDYQTAWAAAGSDSIAWIEVRFPIAVNVRLINIIETFNPNQVAQVEVIRADGKRIPIYKQPPQQIDQICPFTLSIPVEQLDGYYDTIVISIDQTELGLGWNQIDAVELVGVPE